MGLTRHLLERSRSQPSLAVALDCRVLGLAQSVPPAQGGSVIYQSPLRALVA